MTTRELIEFHRFWRDTDKVAVLYALLRSQPEQIKRAFEHFGMLEDYVQLLQTVEAVRDIKTRVYGLNEMLKNLVRDCTKRFDKALDFFVEEQERLSIN